MILILLYCCKLFKQIAQQSSRWKDGTHMAHLDIVCCPFKQVPPQQERNRGLHGPEQICSKILHRTRPQIRQLHSLSIPRRDVTEHPQLGWLKGRDSLPFNPNNAFSLSFYMILSDTISFHHINVKRYTTSCESQICRIQSPLQFVCELEFGLRSDWAAVH